MAQEDNGRDEKDTIKTGRDIPGGDGTISDEDMKAIDPDDGGKPIGQDHSLENHEDSAPTSGIGAIQDYSDRASDIAHIEDEE
ncbi:MAG: hypothetical protein M3525_03520 [Acidobacteriota bacterium]|nr:hypothetical protein [Acidobacteriota bacterium]